MKVLGLHQALLSSRSSTLPGLTSQCPSIITQMEKAYALHSSASRVRINLLLTRAAIVSFITVR